MPPGWAWSPWPCSSFESGCVTFEGRGVASRAVQQNTPLPSQRFTTCIISLHIRIHFDFDRIWYASLYRNLLFWCPSIYSNFCFVCFWNHVVTTRVGESKSEIFVLLGCYVAYVGSWLQTFRDNVSAPSSRVKRSTKNSASLRCVTSQKNGDLICTAVEGWKHADRNVMYKYTVPQLFLANSQCSLRCCANWFRLVCLSVCA